MSAKDLLDRAADLCVPRRVFAEPITLGDTTVIPAAAVRGVGGGGEGVDGTAKQGWGGGFFVTARPAGALEIRDGTVRWITSVDITRVLVGVQVVAVTTLLVRWLIRRTNARASVEVAYLTDDHEGRRA